MLSPAMGRDDSNEQVLFSVPEHMPQNQRVHTITHSYSHAAAKDSINDQINIISGEANVLANISKTSLINPIKVK